MAGKLLFKLRNMGAILRKMGWEEVLDRSQWQQEQSMKLRQVVYASPCSVRVCVESLFEYSRICGCAQFEVTLQHTGYFVQQCSAARNGSSSVVEFAKGCFQKRLSKHDLKQQDALAFYL
ncbi:hypothetical protein T4E_3673 [Trichinella pseudospiralis]|uniref:Uncharacterized protein n=1 Tax=Trichinella pseudospiralis TaxID=6337 RepID=A0A0V0Y390_TRIPS|nr:hypothetical protein T4E_3673 [Trichinella pseudospiralis]